MARLKGFTFRQPPPDGIVWSQEVVDRLLGQRFKLVLASGETEEDNPVRHPIGVMHVTKVEIDKDGALLVTVDPIQEESMTESDTRGNTERVELFKGDDGDWYARRVSANNEETFVSEGHSNRLDAGGVAATEFPGLPIWAEQEDGSWTEWKVDG